MQDGVGSDGNVAARHSREPFRSNVDGCTAPQAEPVADADEVVVGADHRTVPEHGIAADLRFAQNAHLHSAMLGRGGKARQGIAKRQHQRRRMNQDNHRYKPQNTRDLAGFEDGPRSNA